MKELHGDHMKVPKPSKLLESLIKRSEVLVDSALLETSLIRNLALELVDSPQRLTNSLYYRMRVTGTGDVWRSSGGATYRPPDKYINSSFLERCVGLPVVVYHPESDFLGPDTPIVGTTVYSYVPSNKPDEVWCIARIIDGDTQDSLLTDKFSTSPLVVTSESSKDQEGEPLLIDHLAIVPLGVWDHQGPPQGIDQDIMLSADDGVVPTTDNLMDNNEIITPVSSETPGSSFNNAVLKDMDMNAEELRKLLSETVSAAVQPINTRLDKLEVRADADKEPASKGVNKDKEDEEVKKDEELDEPVSEDEDDKEPEEEAEKEDAKEEVEAKGDSDEDSEDKQNSRIAELESEIAKLKKKAEPLADNEVSELADAHAMADSVARLFGKSAKMPMPGERAISYRKRMLSQFKQYSPAWKDVDIRSYRDSALISNIEKQVYADAQVASRKPSDLSPNKLREIRKTLSNGREVVEFVGDPDSWMNEFKIRPAVGKFRSINGQ